MYNEEDIYDCKTVTLAGKEYQIWDETKGNGYFTRIDYATDADGNPVYVCMYTILAAATSALSAFIVQKKHNAAVRRLGDDVEHI